MRLANKKSFILFTVLFVLCAFASAAADGQTRSDKTQRRRSLRTIKTRHQRNTSKSRNSELLKLIADLRAQGVTVRREGEVSQPFFSVKGRAVSVNGESIQVFIYPDSQSAQSEASQVSGSGTSVGTNMMSWTATPHFFRKDRVVVLYLGENSKVRRALEAVLGAQFAGG